MALNPGEVRPVPLAYVWSRIFAKPSTGSVGQWRYCDAPVNWYHIMRKSDNTLDVHSSVHAWNQGRYTIETNLSFDYQSIWSNVVRVLLNLSL